MHAVAAETQPLGMQNSGTELVPFDVLAFFSRSYIYQDVYTVN